MDHEHSSPRNLKRCLSAYALAAGAAVAGVGTSASAYVAYYDNGGSGWFDNRPHFGGAPGGVDMILFKLDGTVLVDDVEIDPALPAGPSIELMGENYNGQYAWGDGKTRDTAFVRCTNAGVVGTYWNDAPEAVKLDPGTVIGPSSEFVTGDVGLYGYGWYSVVGGFGGRGYMGLYIENDQGGRHYGWADLSVSGARNEITLHAFAYETTPDTPLSWILSPPPGDFNRDGSVNDLDVDSIYQYIASGSAYVAEYDLNHDLSVNEDDVTNLIEYLLEYDTDGDGHVDGMGTARGDFNLDGAVNGTDLSIMRSYFGGSAGYAGADANGDSTVNGTDLSLLASSFGFAVSSSPVPEPATLSLLALGAGGLVAHRKRRS